MSRQYSNTMETEIRHLQNQVHQLEDEKLQLKRDKIKLKGQIQDLRDRPEQRPDLSEMTNLYGMPTEEE